MIHHLTHLKLIALIVIPYWCIGSPPPAPKHLIEAAKLLQSLPPEQTSYRHKKTQVQWEGEKGAKTSVSHTDCSGFLNSLIQHSYPKYDADAFMKWFGTKRPLAQTYFDAIVQQKGFQRIDQITAVMPGDIIAVKYMPGADNTGHTMLVADGVKPRPATEPLLEGTEQWEVPIIDSSKSGHGKTDTRRLPDGTYRQGLGQGILRLYTQKSGTLVGYSWSVSPKSAVQTIKTKGLVIGRLDTKYEP